MVIIVEGIDRVGKTTLCNKINKEINFPIYKHVGNFVYSRMDNENETDKMIQLLQLCKITNSTIVFDRFHFTDYVYGVLERNYNVLIASHNVEEIEEFLKEIKAILIYVSPTDVLKSSIEHGSNLEKHDKMFEELFEESKIEHKFRCDYNSLDEALLFIRNIIKESGE